MRTSMDWASLVILTPLCMVNSVYLWSLAVARPAGPPTMSPAVIIENARSNVKYIDQRMVPPGRSIQLLHSTHVGVSTRGCQCQCSTSAGRTVCTVQQASPVRADQWTDESGGVLGSALVLRLRAGACHLPCPHRCMGETGVNYTTLDEVMQMNGTIGNSIVGRRLCNVCHLRNLDSVRATHRPAGKAAAAAVCGECRSLSNLLPRASRFHPVHPDQDSLFERRRRNNATQAYAIPTSAGSTVDHTEGSCTSQDRVPNDVSPLWVQRIV
jgi:hypothetical protein